MINVYPQSEYEFRYEFDSDEELEYFKEFCKTIVTESSYNWKTKKYDNYKKVEYKYYREDIDGIYSYRGIAYALKDYFEALEEPELEFQIHDDDKFIKINDKWINIFANHPRKDLGYDKIQAEAAQAVEGNKIGIISLATGTGKSEILLAIAESYLEQFTGNVLVYCYSNRVKEELELRAEKYSVNSDRLRIINPAGLCRSKYFESDECQEFIKNTGLIIADEAHHFTADSWTKVLKLADPDFLYGMTASADKEDGKKLVPSLLAKNLTSLQLNMMQIMNQAIVHHELRVPMDLYSVTGGFTAEGAVEEYLKTAKNSTRVASLIITPKLAASIRYLIDNYLDEEDLVYIPETSSIENGNNLCNYLNAEGVRTVFMSAAIVSSPIGELQMSLEDLKDLARERAFKVLITNSVGTEGIDIPGLTTLMTFSGNQFKSFIQPLGRAARANKAKCFIFFDKNNYQVMNQSRTKYKIAKSLNVNREYKIVFND